MYSVFLIVYSIRQDLKFTSNSYESLWLEISVGINSKNNRNILVGVIYRHPKASIHEFSKKFSDLLLENINNYKYICIFGGINTNNLSDKNASVKNSINQINVFGLTNIIKVSTRINNFESKFIDHFYCSTQKRLFSAKPSTFVRHIRSLSHFVKIKNWNLVRIISKMKTIPSRLFKNKYQKTFSRCFTYF